MRSPNILLAVFWVQLRVYWGQFLLVVVLDITTGSGDALTYRNRLNEGKYIIVAKGTDSLIRRQRAVKIINWEQIPTLLKLKTRYRRSKKFEFDLFFIGNFYF